MPPPLRRSGSGLLQNPRPGLLPSPKSAGLGPLGPSRVVLSTRQSSPTLRPAASLLLASTLGSRLTLEVDFRAPLVACPGGTHTRRSFGPLLGAPLFELSSSRQPLKCGRSWIIRGLIDALVRRLALEGVVGREAGVGDGRLNVGASRSRTVSVSCPPAASSKPRVIPGHTTKTVREREAPGPRPKFVFETRGSALVVVTCMTSLPNLAVG